MSKFDGVLELTTEDKAQLDKEQFISSVSDEVKYYGLQSFLSNTKEDDTMISLPKESHSFTV